MRFESHEIGFRQDWAGIIIPTHGGVIRNIKVIGKTLEVNVEGPKEDLMVNIISRGENDRTQRLRKKAKALIISESLDFKPVSIDISLYDGSLKLDERKWRLDLEKVRRRESAKSNALQRSGASHGGFVSGTSMLNHLPVSEAPSRDFSFIKDEGLRKIIERDYEEIQRAVSARCWKSVMILCGGAIEAILLDCLSQNIEKSSLAKSAPKGNIERWSLEELIKVSRELELIEPGVDRLSQSVRTYRNLVHPSNELTNRLKVGAEEAKIALEVLHMLHRDFSGDSP